MSEFDRDRLTQKQCAVMFGVTTRTLRDWESLSFNATSHSIGPFPRNEDGTYHFRGMMCWVMLYRLVKR